MNEQIRELEKQATEFVKCGLNGTSTAESFNRKKFAELIVRECLSIMIDAHYSKCNLDDAIWNTRIHFGVEE